MKTKKTTPLKQEYASKPAASKKMSPAKMKMSPAKMKKC